MTKKRPITNVSASIHDRLLQLARRTGMQYQEALQYFAMERFLYRLSISKYAHMFVLKGALMLRVWQIPQSRLTRDIDLLGFTTNTTDHLSAIVRDICQSTVVDDGVVFPPESVTAEVIRQRAEYVGVRVQFVAHSGKSVVPMQIDVGFADAITPAPEMIEYPVMLDFPAPRIRAYPRETTIAEKFHAMADLGFDNTRMKDFYDLWQMLRLFTFDGDRLAGAIHATFERRGREALPEEPVAFADAFITSTAKETQWKAFVRKNRLNNAPTWPVAVRAIRDWLKPILEPARTRQPFNFTWHPEDGWR